MGNGMTKSTTDDTSWTKEFDHDDNIDLKSETVVENIHIDGVAKTEDELITKQLEDVLTAKTFEEVIAKSHDAKLRLQRLGIFKAIEIFVDVNRDENASKKGLDVHFMVEEARRLTANAGTSVGNNEGSMVLGLRLNNLRGKAETVKLDASIGSRVSSSYELGVSKPMFKNADTKLGVRLNRATTDYPQSAFTERCHGLLTDITYPGAFGMHGFSFDNIWRENLGMKATTPFSIREMAGHNLKTSAKYTFTSDGRNDWILPSSGALFKQTIELASPLMFGNCNFVKSETEVQLNKRLVDDIVIGCTLQGGCILPLGDKPLNINDKFFLGGPLSLRGFQMKSVGPRDEHAALGGNAYVAGGLHVYTPLPFRPGEGGFGDYFRLHFFANAGNLISSETSLPNYNHLKDLVSDFRWSYGLGIMFMLGSVARLEVNYCFPKNAQAGDGISPGLQVGVGLSFL